RHGRARVPAGQQQVRRAVHNPRLTSGAEWSRHAEIDCVEESLELFGDAAYTPGILGEPVPVADDADRQTRLLGRLGRRG
ncbi:hypothetical protein ACNQUF_11635, partial [Corynebacterium diphtheriae]